MERGYPNYELDCDCVLECQKCGKKFTYINDLEVDFCSRSCRREFENEKIVKEILKDGIQVLENYKVFSTVKNPHIDHERLQENGFNLVLQGDHDDIHPNQFQAVVQGKAREGKKLYFQITGFEYEEESYYLYEKS